MLSISLPFCSSSDLIWCHLGCIRHFFLSFFFLKGEYYTFHPKMLFPGLQFISATAFSWFLKDSGTDVPSLHLGLSTKKNVKGINKAGGASCHGV